jgi:hypothetical protein
VFTSFLRVHNLQCHRNLKLTWPAVMSHMQTNNASSSSSNYSFLTNHEILI